MKEGEPQTPFPIEKARRERRPRAKPWDVTAVAQHLGSVAEPIRDMEHGDGFRVLIGLDEPVTSLELYPKAKFARVETAGMRLELTEVAPPVPPAEPLPADHESVLLIGERNEHGVRLSFNAQGYVLLHAEPHEPLLVRPLTDVRADVTSEATESEAASQPEQNRRVVLTGRVGTLPFLRTTSKGVLVARFPLAVHENDEFTAWHQVLAFGPRAERVRNSLKKGQEVEVIGYVHQREAPLKGGGTRAVEEVYLASVKPL